MQRSCDRTTDWLVRRSTRSARIPAGAILIGLAVSARLLGEDVVTNPLRSFSGTNRFPLITQVGFSPDGQRLATGARDQMYNVGYGEWQGTIWNAETGESLYRHQSWGVLLAAEFTLDRPMAMVSLGGGDLFQVHDLVTGEVLREFRDTPSVPCGSGALSRDGRLGVTGYGLTAGAKLWDISTGGLVRRFWPHDAGVVAVTFSKDGQRLLTGSFDRTVKLWELATGNLLRMFVGHTDGVLTVGLSSDNRFVVSGSRDRTARVWHSATGTPLHTLEGNAWVWSAAFSPNSELVLTGSQDGTAKVWATATGQLLRTFDPGAPGTFSVAWSPDGRYVLTGHADATARLWSVAGLGERLEIAPSGSGAELRWSLGVLQEAGSLSGPWQDVPGAASPFQAELLGVQRFYRLRIAE